MSRRRFLIAQGIWLLAVATNTLGQAGHVKRISVLSSDTLNFDHPVWRAFLEALKESGYIEKRDFLVESRAAEGQLDKLPALAAQLVATKPAVLITSSTAGTTAARNATASVPIVFVGIGNPVRIGLIASLRRPGGNITGVSGAIPGGGAGLDGKLFELIRDTLPKSNRIATLMNNADPVHRRYLDRISPAAAAKGFEMLTIYVARAEDLERAFADLATMQMDALYVPDLSLFHVQAPRIGELARKTRVPLFARPPISDYAGGLISLDIDHVENWRRAGKVVSQILKGGKPAEIPVEQPERVYLTINLKTAREIGVSIPQSVLIRANRVIE